MTIILRQIFEIESNMKAQYTINCFTFFLIKEHAFHREIISERFLDFKIQMIFYDTKQYLMDFVFFGSINSFLFSKIIQKSDQ